jgi:hypothetical protein
MNTLEAACDPKKELSHCFPERWTAHSQMGTNLTFISVHFEANIPNQTDSSNSSEPTPSTRCVQSTAINNSILRFQAD